DFTCPGGTPTRPCRPVFNFATGGLGNSPADRNSSRRDQYRADLNLYVGNHEVKLGSDYQQAKTVVVSHLSGGQLANRYNDFGQVYYRHFFHARSPTDLTPADIVVQPRTADV